MPLSIRDLSEYTFEPSAFGIGAMWGDTIATVAGQPEKISRTEEKPHEHENCLDSRS
jgi:hypothetical protein